MSEKDEPQKTEEEQKELDVFGITSDVFIPALIAGLDGKPLNKKNPRRKK